MSRTHECKASSQQDDCRDKGAYTEDNTHTHYNEMVYRAAHRHTPRVIVVILFLYDSTQVFIRRYR